MIAVQYFFMSLPYLIAVAFGLALPFLAISIYRRFGAGLGLVATTFLVDALTMVQGQISLGINLYFADLGLIPVAGVAVLRLFFANDFPFRHKYWLLFCVLVIAAIFIGLATYGTAAGVQGRPYFYFIATGLYAMSFPMNDRRIRQVLNTLVWIAGFLFVLTLYRWIVYYTPLPDLLPPGGTYNPDGAMRVIQSNFALVLAEALVGGLFFSVCSRGLHWAQLAAPLLFGWVVALQHRSVWLATLTAVFVRFLVVRSNSLSSAKQLLLVLGIGVLTAIPLMASDKLSGVAEQVGQSAQRALQGKDTTGERFNNWKAVIQQWYGGGPKSIVIGMGFGGDNTRYVENVGSAGYHKAEYYAHNMYVQTLYNTGLAGLGALIATFAFVLRGLYQLTRSRESGSSAQVLLVLMIMQMVYYVPYGTDYLQSLLLGVAIAYVAERLPKSVAPASRDFPRKRQI